VTSTEEHQVDDRSRAVLRRLELDVTRRLDGLLQGDYRGLVSGLGSEPGEARAYAPGDDVRRIDWSVTARMQETHVRDTVADRELETSILVDVSPSLTFGTAQRTKAELALAAVAAIGFLTDRVGNRLGAVATDGRQIHEFRTGTGRRNLLALLHRIHRLSEDEAQRSESEGHGSLAEGLHRIAGPQHRGGLAVVISDLLDDGWEQPLRRVCQRHDTLVMEIVDPRELELPNVGVIELRDQETGAVREVDTRSRKLRDRFVEAGRQRLADHADAVRTAGADHLVLRTDRDWVVDLAVFVDRRRRSGRVNRQARP
jgi:uncharacterized protein (DUF58 family)